MSKEEIALELTKLTYGNALHNNKMQSKGKSPEEIVTELYNFIFANLKSEQSK